MIIDKTTYYMYLRANQLCSPLTLHVLVLLLTFRVLWNSDDSKPGSAGKDPATSRSTRLEPHITRPTIVSGLAPLRVSAAPEYRPLRKAPAAPPPIRLKHAQTDHVSIFGPRQFLGSTCAP